MDVVLHPSVEAYEEEYTRVRATLVARGTSLTAYLQERGINRQIACKALRGRAFGKNTLQIRATILRDVLGGMK